MVRASRVRARRGGLSNLAWLFALLAAAWWLQQRTGIRTDDQAPPTTSTAPGNVPAAPQPDDTGHQHGNDHDDANDEDTQHSHTQQEDTPQDHRGPHTRIPTVAVDPHSPWASRQACEAAIGAIVAQPRARALRIASWNLHWFPDGRGGGKPNAEGGTDIAWLACAITSLRADVVAIQEVTTGVRGRTAMLSLIERLDALTPGARFAVYLDDCPDDGRQHLGWLYDQARVQLDHLRDMAELNAYGGACAKRLRPGVAGRLHDLRGASDDIDLITVHLDSGSTERDYRNRLKSMRRLSEALPAQGAHLVIGDFNTMGCAECRPVIDVDTEVAAIEQLLSSRAYRFVRAVAGQPVCSEHFEGRPQWLDRAVGNVDATVQAAGLCAELRCQRPRTTSLALSSLSDHCPIVVELPARRVTR